MVRLNDIFIYSTDEESSLVLLFIELSIDFKLIKYLKIYSSNNNNFKFSLHKMIIYQVTYPYPDQSVKMKMFPLYNAVLSSDYGNELQ